MKTWHKIALTKRRIDFKGRFARHGSEDKGNNRRRAVGRLKYPVFIVEVGKLLNLEV